MMRLESHETPENTDSCDGQWPMLHDVLDGGLLCVL